MKGLKAKPEDSEPADAASTTASVGQTDPPTAPPMPPKRIPVIPEQVRCSSHFGLSAIHHLGQVADAKKDGKKRRANTFPNDAIVSLR